MNTSLAGRVAVVTGGASGIGRGIAIELSKAGAVIAIADMDQSKGEALARDMSSRGEGAIAVHLDVTCSDSVRGCIDEVIRRTSGIDILVNNAGIFQRDLGLNLDGEGFNRCLDVNLTGIWRITRELVPHFRSRGGGRVINIASTGGRRGIGFAPAYCASKAGVISLTQSLASALGADGINVNAVCPGAISTAMRDEIAALGANLSPASTGGGAYAISGELSVEDIGQAVLFFASTSSRNITGQALNVDRGFHMN